MEGSATEKKLILVTGAAGFVGSALCRRLIAEGHRVIGIDNFFAGSRDNVAPGVDFREGHTKNISTLVTETPDLIYHLGEYSRVEISLTEPAVVWDLNIAGTSAVLEFWRQKNQGAKSKLVYAGSSTKFADDGLGRDQSPYAWSKATNSELVRNYGEWYSLPFATTYFYNVYGPGERAGKYGTVIEIFKQKIQKGEPLMIHAPGTQRRIFTHIDDIVDGLMLVGEKGEGDEFGLGADKSFSILEVAQLFGAEVVMGPEVAGNRMSAVIDTSKSRVIGWLPKHELDAHIQEFLASLKK